jgi:hypothetical protein
MIYYIINYISKLFYGEPVQFIPPAKTQEHLNEIKNFEFKKNRHYYFKY